MIAILVANMQSVLAIRSTTTAAKQRLEQSWLRYGMPLCGHLIVNPAASEGYSEV
jgi:hypothetical protein